MNRKAAIAISLLLALMLPACAKQPDTRATYDPSALRFDGQRAFDIESTFVTRFTHRDSGKPNSKLATEWLRDRLAGLGGYARFQEWETVNYSRRVPMRNVIWRLPGKSRREILVMAHHDHAPTTVQGADNDGSGVAILLHLAEIFASEPSPKYTLVLVATDGEEYGMLGSRHYIRTHPDPGNIVAGISLDNLGKRFYDGVTMEPRGQSSGYGPLWLQLTAERAARAAGDIWVPHVSPPLDQVLFQAVPVAFMDQGPVVSAGVPALGFAGRVPPQKVKLHDATYHTPQDTIELQSPRVIEQSGRVAEALIRQLLAMDTFPQESGGPYLYFESRRQVLRGAPLWLILIGFVALFFAGSYLVVRRLDSPVPEQGGVSLGFVAEALGHWRRALPHFLGLWLPLVTSVALLHIFVWIGLMDSYQMYPATPKDPATYSPRWPAVILFLVGLGFFLALGRSVARRYAGRFTEPDTAAEPTPKFEPDFGEVKSLALLAIGLAGIYLLVVSPFSLLFFVPVLSWFLIAGRRGAGRVLDIVLLLLGGLVVYALFYVFGFEFLGIGFAMAWYLMMMFSIGMIGFPTAVAIMGVVAAGLSMVVDPPRHERTARAAVLVRFLQRHGLTRSAIYKLGRGRAQNVVAQIKPYLDGAGDIIDVGAGTCNVCELLTERGFGVTPVDVEDLSFVDGMKARLYDGERLPFDDDAFDIALVLAVLHHTREPEKVLAEAARVARRVIVIEDIHRNRIHKYVTCFLDSLLNLEFWGHPHANRSDAEWRALFDRMNLTICGAIYDSAFGVLQSVAYCLERQ